MPLNSERGTAQSVYSRLKWQSRSVLTIPNRCLEICYSGPGRYRNSHFLDRNDYSLFSDGEQRLLGQPIKRFFPVLQGSCKGNILQRREIRSHFPGLYLSGEKERNGNRILIASSGLIEGLGFAKLQVPNSWAGFVRPTSGPLQVYAVTSHNSICLIAVSGK